LLQIAVTNHIGGVSGSPQQWNCLAQRWIGHWARIPT